MASQDFNIRVYLDLLFYHKRLFIITALTIMTGAVLISYALPKEYEAKSTVFIEKNIMSELVKGLAVTPSIEEKVRVLTYAMSSRTLLVKVFDDLDMNTKKMSDKQLEELVKETQKNLKIKTSEKEGFFQITFIHDNPKFARDLVNTLVRRYIEENVSSKREDAYGANTFLTEQIEVFKKNLEKADDKITDYQKNKSIASVSNEVGLHSEVASAQRQLEELQLKRQQLEDTRSTLQQNSPASLRLKAAEQRLNELLITYTDTYPEVVRLKGEIETMRAQQNVNTKSSPVEVAAQQRLDSELKAIKYREAMAIKRLAKAQADLGQIPLARQEMEEMNREKQSARSTYEALLMRQNQSELSKQLEIQDKSSTFRVVDPAVIPVDPARPNRVMIMLAGIAIGLGVGFGLVWILDSLDDSVKLVSSIKNLGVPVLGVIPRMENIQDLLLQKKHDFRLFNISGAYFSVIIVVIIMEALKISFVDTMFNAINFQQHVAWLRTTIVSIFR